jgi:hypothetical protein
LPCSGNQLVEFVPPSLAADCFAGPADTAEIGVGPNFLNPCHRFDLYKMHLGCATEKPEDWCEFEVSAYTHVEGSLHEESKAWRETKRVPGCANFSQGNCPLAPVEFVGFTNMTSVLITLHVGLELRVWWADDMQVGWTDNSCEASMCRAQTRMKRDKRQRVEAVLERGTWHWTKEGLERLDDNYILEAAK